MLFNQKGTLGVKVNQMPVVVISDLALQKMEAFTQCCDEEIGWLGTVIKYRNVYTINDVFLFKQKVHGATCELDENDIMEWTERMLNQPNGLEIVNSMKVWGHSHVKMSNTPSGQDEQQFEELAKNSDDYFIRIITNKLGALRVDFWDKQLGVTYNCVQWVEERQNLVDLDAIKKEINEKVSKITYTQYAYQGNNKYAGKYYDYTAKCYKDAPKKNESKQTPNEEEDMEAIYNDYLHYTEEDDELDDKMFYYYEDAQALMYDFGLTYDEVFTMADMSALRLKAEFEENHLGANEEMSILEAEYILKIIQNHIYEQQ